LGKRASSDRTSLEARPLEGRRVIVAVTGGIASYKSATLVSRLVQRGAAVRVIMTEAATRFVAPLTFQSLSGQSVLTSIWDADDRPDSQHIGLARWCELMIIAPATANTIARMAHGLCDDVVSLAAAALPRGTPLLLAPAMNADMWANPIVQRNLTTLREVLGCATVGPEEGWQACRTQGQGRMSEPDDILAAAETLLHRSAV
jgi:phosphopantothenoylcysteine synthetase/decarboxylase